ncbi:uncharacterized protein LOC135388683 isoform X2 [Ornithodoros turicata]|uniref:uncharacterized protein LOC135388683 isoform X2 n=1 Tax=Ornithodoros turicata TaxID=34597 RepID=UPI0031394ECF
MISLGYTTGSTIKCKMSAVLILMFICSVGGTLVFSGAVLDKQPALNNYADTIFNTVLPRHLADRPRVFPLDDIHFKVKSTGITNRELSAEFHNGRLTGLTTPPALKRFSDCGTVREGRYVIMHCNLLFGQLSASYNGSLDGESLFGSSKSIDVLAVFTQPRGYIEVLFLPDVPPKLKSWSMLSLNMVFHFSRPLDLNDERTRMFQEQLRRSIGDTVTGVIYGPLKEDLSTSVPEAMLYALR